MMRVSALAVLVLFLLGALVIVDDTADGATPSTGRTSGVVSGNPCWEAALTMPWNGGDGASARACRAEKWTVRKRATVSPRGAAITGLRPCEREDSEGCYWNARTRGNGAGQSFINLPGLGQVPVSRINGERA